MELHLMEAEVNNQHMHGAAMRGKEDMALYPSRDTFWIPRVSSLAHRAHKDSSCISSFGNSRRHNPSKIVVEGVDLLV
jgi:hypothetical protein